MMEGGGRAAGAVAEPGRGGSWLREHLSVVGAVPSTRHVAFS